VAEMTQMLNVTMPPKFPNNTYTSSLMHKRWVVGFKVIIYFIASVYLVFASVYKSHMKFPMCY